MPNNDKLFYAGIGSRETPDNILNLMSRIATWLEESGYILRSGGAGGADLAFEHGVTGGNKEIYLPWKGFNGSSSSLYGWPSKAIEDAALRTAEEAHPAWDRCSQGARKMHTRNVAQIFGSNLDIPVHMVVCWTKEAKGAGGTGQAIRIAKAYDIPVFDLGVSDIQAQLAALKAHVSTMELVPA